MSCSKTPPVINTALSPVDALNVDVFSEHGVDLRQVYEGISNEQYAQVTVSHSARQGFKVGSLCLMIGYADGSELIDIPAIYHVPNAPEWLSGVINLHGVVIPVFDLANYFSVSGINTEHSNKKMLLILGQGNSALAIIIDGLPLRMHANAEQEVDRQTAPQLLQKYVKSAYFIDNQLWFDLDSRSLCQSLEEALC